MRVLVWGLGYVGAVSAACLAQLGHEVVGVESNAAKVEQINGGRGPVKERGLDQLIGRAVAAGRLRAVCRGEDVVPWADVSVICVGTPSAHDGSPDLAHVREVAGDIGRGLTASDRYHVVIMRSTVRPGTTRQVLIPLLEAHSHSPHGSRFGVVTNPDFTRETVAVEDFLFPPYTVIGQINASDGLRVVNLYEGLTAPVVTVGLEEAELLKLASNAFHALKVGFANEIGRLADRLGVDGRKVMNLVGADATLNASPAYLEPGFAFGGSCLPKDLRSLTAHAREMGAELPILQAVTPSNVLHIEAARAKVRALGVRRVAVLGLGFKKHSGDVRESPAVALIRGLVEDGMDVTTCDPQVHLDEMLGANRAYLECQLPRIREMLRPTIDEALEGCQVVVVTHKRLAYSDAVASLPSHIAVLDLVGLDGTLRREKTNPAREGGIESD